MAATSLTTQFPYIDEIFQKQQANRWHIARTSASERIQWLKALRKLIDAEKETIASAIYADFMKPEAETYLTEIALIFKEIDHTTAHLHRWMRPFRKGAPLPYVGTKNYVQYEPKGTTLIMAPWNYPFQLAIGPLISAIAAGNTAIVKPSELAPHTSQIIQELIPRLFEEDHVAVVTGTADVAQYLTHLPFDHIFFTGSTAKGKLIMQAAAENLTTITLELGGKSPVIVTSHADIPHAARRIAWGKFLNGGQTCIAPDYALVHQAIYDSFVESLLYSIEKLWGKPEEQSQPRQMTHIINKGHFHRLQHLIEDAVQNGAILLYGGNADERSRFIQPTVLGNPPKNALVLQEEIFGPILPIVPFDKLDTALQFIQSRNKPLALYIFSKNKKEVKTIIRNTTAGGTVINDVLHHFSNPDLPFGGINHSGIGKAHGFYGFQAFSNMRAVMKLPKYHAADLIMPPYTRKVMKIIKLALKYL